VIKSFPIKSGWLLLALALAATPSLAQSTVGEVFSGDASVRGSVLLSGSGAHVVSGSQVAAGDGAAVLKLERGGNLRICPHTTLSVSADASGKALVLGLNAGAMELDYTLNSAADALITPDFRMQLISPGTFHLAISVARSGDTCVRTLPGNDASVFVAEMLGNDSYQLSPGKNVLFAAGKIKGATEARAMCGCPEVKTELLKAAAAPPDNTLAPLPPESKEKEVVTTAAPAHLEVDSSFVYHGEQAQQDLYTSVSRLSLSTDNSQLALALLPHVTEIEKPKAPEKKQSILQRLGSFFARLFR